MPVLKKSAPPESLQVFQSRFPARALPGALVHTAPPAAEIHMHRVFHANPADLAAGKGLASAKVLAWRYLFSEAPDKHTAHEIRMAGRKGRHQFKEAGFGAAVDEMKALLPLIERLETLQHYTYEPALLRLTALKISTLWLRAYRRHLDYFIPLSPCFYGLKPGQLYAADQFLPIAQEAARQFLARTGALEDDLRGG